MKSCALLLFALWATLGLREKEKCQGNCNTIDGDEVMKKLEDMDETLDTLQPPSDFAARIEDLEKRVAAAEGLSAEYAKELAETKRLAVKGDEDTSEVIRALKEGYDLEIAAMRAEAKDVYDETLAKALEEYNERKEADEALKQDIAATRDEANKRYDELKEEAVAAYKELEAADIKNAADLEEYIKLTGDTYMEKMAEALAAFEQLEAADDQHVADLAAALEELHKEHHAAVDEWRSGFSELKEADAKTAQELGAYILSSKSANDEVNNKLAAAVTEMQQGDDTLATKLTRLEIEHVNAVETLNNADANTMAAVDQANRKIDSVADTASAWHEATLLQLNNDKAQTAASLDSLNQLNLKTAQDLRNYMDLNDKQFRDLAANAGKKIHVGVVPASEFVPYPQTPNSFFVDVNFPELGLTKTPEVWAVLKGESGNWRIEGITSIYRLSPDHFRIYIHYNEDGWDVMKLSKETGWEIHYYILPNE